MIIETLKAYPKTSYTAYELAEKLIERYPESLRAKRRKARYANETFFIRQLAKEIHSNFQKAQKKCSNIALANQSRPKRLFWQSHSKHFDQTDSSHARNQQQVEPSQEYNLYPDLMKYLYQKMGLYCYRIDERRSHNTRGNNGNHWLHPDIVALEPIDQNWHEAIRTCVRYGHHNSARLWSFEVKQDLTRSNVRSCFFQAVSNSSWANLGYLVTTGLKEGVEPELRILASLHGIGVLLLNKAKLSQSQILIPAQERLTVDWQSANRIIEINQDFKEYIELISIYYQTGKLRHHDWHHHKAIKKK